MAKWWERQRLIFAVALISALVGAILASVLRQPEPPPIRVVQPTSVPTPSVIVVHVSGAVATPGVYHLPTGARVLDGLAAAGGATEHSNPHALNLAAPLRDGQQVVVPEQGTSAALADSGASPASESAAPAPINLNQATEAQLDTLPGIGPVTARRVLDFRARVGRFERVEQLLEERLVNRPTFDNIKELVTVE